MAVQDRRKLILEKAAPLLAEKGIAGCTVRDIARGVGILSGSLYYYFDSKDALVEEIVMDYLTTLQRRYSDVVEPQSDPRKRLYALVLASLEVSHAHAHASEIYQSNRKYFASSTRFNAVRKAAAKLQGTWSEVIERGVEQGAFRDDVNPRVFHRFLRDAVFLSPRWHKPAGDYRLSDLADDTARVFLDGFTAVRRS
jgi:AcrR family transcriptional regulator